MRARWWTRTRRNGQEGALCGLCGHACFIPENGRGRCGSRTCTRTDGLVSPLLGKFCSAMIDPVEKKPLRRWRPGTHIFSLGGLHCTMRCPFCQNHSIAHPGTDIPLFELTPSELKDRVLSAGLAAVAYTYNEPLLQAEYILEAAPTLEKAGIATVLVTNGMVTENVLEELAPAVAAANVDVKSFCPDAYVRLGGSLETACRTVERLFARGVHVEVTHLVVPGISDQPEDCNGLVRWLSGISRDIPLHIARYRPQYRYTAPPTDPALLHAFAAAAAKELRHVYLGNI